MKKFFFIAVLLCAALVLSQDVVPVPKEGMLNGAGSEAGWLKGGPCDIGNTAAATLLIPYFEVADAWRTGGMGMDTLVAVTNLGDHSTVAHVVFWDPDNVAGIPSYGLFDFNIYLTAKDVATFSVKDILINGRLPNNGCIDDSDRFTDDFIDCDGDGSYFGQADPDNQFGVTGYNMDIACYGTIGASLLTAWQNALAIGSGASKRYVGYITIDNTITCSGALPDYNPYGYVTPYVNTNDDNLCAGATDCVDHSVIAYENLLMGDIIYFDPAGNQSDGVPAVHIEALGEQNWEWDGVAAPPAQGTQDDFATDHLWGFYPEDIANNGTFTFWTNYIDYVFSAIPLGAPWIHRDLREPLPIWWGFRYMANSEAFDGGTWLDCWRNHNWDQVTAGVLPSPVLIVYDEEENATEAGGGVSPPPSTAIVDVCPIETQREHVELPDWPLVADNGWVDIRFDTDFLDAGVVEDWDQSWLNVRFEAQDKYTVGFGATTYRNGCINFLTFDAAFNVLAYPAYNHLVPEP